MKQKIKIRQGIFETNSSSSHSFSMGPEGRFEAKLVMDSNGIINVSGDSWNNLIVEKSNDPEVKLSYLLSFAWTISCGEEDEWMKFRDFIYQVVKDFTGATGIEFTPTERIDHQSTDIIDSRDLMNPEFIKEFIFNEGTWIYILWDSDCPEDDFWERTDESHDKLYKLQFNLPGVDPGETTLTLSYWETADFTSELYDFLSKFVYLPEEKILKELKGDEIPPAGSWIYKGDYKYGNTTEEIQIELPKIELA